MKSKLKTGHLEIFARNPLISKQFYCDMLGFEEVTIQNGNFVWLQKESLEILIRPKIAENTPPSKKYEEGKIGWVFYTDNLQEAAKDLEAKGLIFKGTIDSDKCLTFTDPDGNWFQLVNPNNH